MAEKTQLKMRTKIENVERVVNEWMSKIFRELNKRCQNHSTESFEYEYECVKDTEEIDM